MIRPLLALGSALLAVLLHEVVSWFRWTAPRVALIGGAVFLLALPHGSYRLRSAAAGQVITADGVQVLRYGAGHWFAPVRDRWGFGGFHHFQGTDADGRTLGLVLVPRWFFPLAAVLGFGTWAGVIACDRRRAAVESQRHRAGLCRACGYDLRATPEKGGALLDRCPECGTVPAHASRPV